MDKEKTELIKEESAISKDFFYKGKIIVFQNIEGFRFSVDAPILADFLPYSTREALEIGSGCGIISLLALHHKKFPCIQAVEIQESLNRLAVKNITANGFSSKMKVIQNDFKKIYHQFKGITEVFANPPFFKTTTGRLSPNPEIKTAKSEYSLTLPELFYYVYLILGRKGNFYLILPYQRYSEIIGIVKKTGFFPVRIREVYTVSNGKPTRFLIQLTNYEISSTIISPLIIYKDKKKGIYTDEMEKIVEG